MKKSEAKMKKPSDISSFFLSLSQNNIFFYLTHILNQYSTKAADTQSSVFEEMKTTYSRTNCATTYSILVEN